MEYDAKIRNRLKRVEGQIKGIIRMVDSNEECKDVITQLSNQKLSTSPGHWSNINQVYCGL